MKILPAGTCKITLSSTDLWCLYFLMASESLDYLFWEKKIKVPLRDSNGGPLMAWYNWGCIIYYDSEWLWPWKNYEFMEPLAQGWEEGLCIMLVTLIQALMHVNARKLKYFKGQHHISQQSRHETGKCPCTVNQCWIIENAQDRCSAMDSHGLPLLRAQVLFMI